MMLPVSPMIQDETLIFRNKIKPHFYISIHGTRCRFMFPYYIMKEQFGQEACETAKGLLYYITIRLPMIGRGGNVDDTEGTCNVT